MQTYMPFDISPICKGELHDTHIASLDNRLSTLADRVDVVEGVITAMHTVQSTLGTAPRRNYALHGGGAIILPELTSPTFRLSPPTLTSQFLKWFRGLDLQDSNINLPIVILEDNVAVGECWEFEGGYGYVGIQLPERVLISHVSLNYVDPALISIQSMARAPSTITLWGVVKSDDVNKDIPADVETRSFLDFSGWDEWSVDVPDRFIPLAHLNYNISSSSLLQHFPISVDDRLRNMTFHAILLEITSNWGSNTTCLYFVGIHGATLD